MDETNLKNQLLLLLIVCVITVQGVIKIVEPFPSHKVAIENETLTVTCVAYDEANPNVKPLGIEFYRVNKVGERIVIKNGGDYAITKRTQENGRKVFTSLIFNRIKPEDRGSYECKVLNTTDAKYGFGITYISYNSLPQISVSPSRTVEFGDDLSLQCNVTRKGSFFVSLETMKWSKNSETISAATRPNDIKLRDISMEIDTPSDAGVYKCQLSTLLHQQRTYNITRYITIQVKPKFNSLEPRGVKIVRTKGESVHMFCNATGNPITVIWKRQPRNADKNLTLDMGGRSNESHYVLSSATPFEGFQLDISSTEYSDRGLYYCCITTNMTTDHEICQKYILRIKDPLGFLWPLIGILLEALVLAVIIYASKRFKVKRAQDESSEMKVEFKYTAGEDKKDGGKDGRIRLRRGETSTALLG